LALVGENPEKSSRGKAKTERSDNIVEFRESVKGWCDAEAVGSRGEREGGWTVILSTPTTGRERPLVSNSRARKNRPPHPIQLFMTTRPPLGGGEGG